MLSDFKLRASEWEQAQERQEQLDTLPQIKPEELDHYAQEDEQAIHGSVQAKIGVTVTDQFPQASNWPAMFAEAAAQYSAIAAAMFDIARPDAGSHAARRVQHRACL